MARNFRGSGSRMPKHWAAIGNITPTVFTVGSTNINGGLLAFDEAWTVMRLIGEYIIGPDAAPVVGDHCNITVAIGVFSTDSTATTAIPDPFAEPGYPWLYWASHSFAFEEASLEVGSQRHAVRRQFDVHSMRKVKPSESLGIVAEYTDGSGAPLMAISYARTRVLVAR